MADGDQRLQAVDVPGDAGDCLPAVFLRVHDAIARRPDHFALLLPIIKIFARSALTRTMVHARDDMP